MTGILSAILCYLKDMLAYALDIVLVQWDGILGAVDALLATIAGPLAFSVSPIPAQYAWLLGSTGLGEALTIIAIALGVRFALQSIPFVRWGT